MGKSLNKKDAIRLWVQSGGRCAFAGCNKYLLEEQLTKRQYNFGEQAHIKGKSCIGPRGGSDSHNLADELDNHILLCEEHHKLIDNKNEEACFTIERLQEMKKKHEQRIKSLTSMHADREVQPLIFTAPIGINFDPNISEEEVDTALLEEGYYPAGEPRLINPKPSYSDSFDHFYTDVKKAIDTEIDQFKKSKMYKKPVAVFALAPIPALAYLGASLGEIKNPMVFARHRDRQSPNSAWLWDRDDIASANPLKIIPPDTEVHQHKQVALLLCLSARIPHEQCSREFDGDVDIWEITCEDPSNTMLRSRDQLVEFRRCFHEALSRIKHLYGGASSINLFPAVPAAIGVLIGLAHMPKADLSLRVFDSVRNETEKAFRFALTIE